MKHLIKLALVLLASVAAFLVYGFTTATAPVAVAALAAGSLVSTYIGLAFAEVPAGQQRNARRVAASAMVIEALYGTLYVLGLQYPAFFAAPPVWAAIPLAMLHGASFSVLAYFVSLFVLHAQADAPAGSPEERVAVILADALRPVLPAQAEPQASYPRAQAEPAPEAVQPVPTLPDACPVCGKAPTQMQARTARQHQGWMCKECGKRVSPQ